MTTPDLPPVLAPDLAPDLPAEPGPAGVEPTAEELRKRRRKKIALLLLILLAVAILLTIYLLWFTGKSADDLPGIGGASNMPQYSFSMYGVARPLGVAVSTNGDRVYVTESDGPRLVHVYDRDGKEVGAFKPPGATGAGRVPVYVAVDPLTDDVYVSDRIAQAVYVYDASGKYKREFKPPRAALGGGWQPLGLAFDAEANLYVTDVSGPSNRVMSFTRAGKLLHRYGKAGQFSFPNGIAVDRWGNVYVADSNNGRVVVFDKAGKPLTGVSSGSSSERLGLPRGEAIDTSNRLFVVDTTDQSVQVFGLHDEGTTPPTFIGSFGQLGQAEGAFAYPNGIATDGGDRIYVTDRENNRVQVWSR